MWSVCLLVTNKSTTESAEATETSLMAWTQGTTCQVKDWIPPDKKAILVASPSILHTHTHTHSHTHTQPVPERSTNLDLQKHETVSGSGISWAICMSAPRSRQITTPAPQHSVFYRPDALPAVQRTTSKHWRQFWHSPSTIRYGEYLACS